MQAWNVFPPNFGQKLWQRWSALHWNCARAVATGICICAFIFICICNNEERFCQKISSTFDPKYLQAKTKDLPSESHSVQNISDPIIGQNTSQVKQNCCSKVFWTLLLEFFAKNFLISWSLPDLWMPKNALALSHAENAHLEYLFPMTNHQHIWIEMTQAHLSPES